MVIPVIESVTLNTESYPKNTESFFILIESEENEMESMGTKRLTPVVSTEGDAEPVNLFPGTAAFCAIARPKQVNAMIYRKIRLN